MAMAFLGALVPETVGPDGIPMELQRAAKETPVRVLEEMLAEVTVFIHSVEN